MSNNVHGHRLGVEAEEAAANYLANSGYDILARNYRGDRCEIDIVASCRNDLVFVEVKSSNSPIHPETEVDAKKIDHLIRAANAYMMTNRNEYQNIRFDLIAMRFAKGLWKINHIEDAFRP
ncbi:MAG: YraN family protein [FCB group bacterium]|nr:YraN family protein [FCB group bacterium]